jgi:cell division protein FtsB
MLSGKGTGGRLGWVGALIGALLLLLLLQQSAQMDALKFQVAMLKREVDYLQENVKTLKAKTDNLSAFQESSARTIGELNDTELRREMAYCRMFPQTNLNCKWLLAMAAGQDIVK